MDRRPKLLIVEDEGIVGLDLQEKLTSAGYDVPQVTPSAAEAIRCIEADRPDLVLMDIRIQGPMDGIATAEMIRKRFALPIIFVTAHADVGTLGRAREIGPFGYIVKPISALTLTGTIEMALHKHQMERRMAEHRAWLSTVLNTIPDAVVVTDTQGKVEFMNAAACTLLGRMSDGALGANVAAVLPLQNDETPDFTEHAFERAMLSGEFRLPRETFLHTADGRGNLLVEGQVALSRADVRVAGAVFTLRDVSERGMEDQQIRQEQKMLVLGQFAADLSETFYGLFHGISDSCTRLQEFARNLPDGDSLRRACTLGMLLARDLRDLGHYQSLRPEAVDLNEVIQSTAGLLRNFGGQTLELHLELCKEPAMVLSHRNHLEHVLINVFAHARERLSGAGTIRVLTETLEGQRGLVRMRVEVEKPASADWIPAGPSSEPNAPGIDLSVASAIITAAEGALHVENGASQNSNVEILLPRQRASSLAGHGFAERRGVVLVLGADPPTTLALEKHLEQECYVVISSASAAEALFVAHYYDGKIDAVVADTERVSAKNRERVRAAFLDRNSETRFLALGRDSAGREGEWEIIHKPFQARDIAASLAGSPRDGGPDSGSEASRAAHV